MNQVEIVDRMMQVYGVHKQKDLADELDVTDVTISKWKNKKTRIKDSVFERIAKKKGITVEWLKYGGEMTEVSKSDGIMPTLNNVKKLISKLPFEDIVKLSKDLSFLSQNRRVLGV